MNFIPKLRSLEDIALFKIAASLWNQYGIRDILDKNFRNLPTFQDDYNAIKGRYIKTERKVFENMLQLPLPTCLKKKIEVYIHTIHLQIFMWMQYHLSHCRLDLGPPKELFWTSYGTIDKKKTAEVLISDDSIDVATRCKLACIYCLEDDIRKLWNEVPDRQKKTFYSVKDPYTVFQMELVEFWSLYINGENDCIRKIARRRLNKVCSPFQYAFECAVSSGSKVATEYFLQKLNPKKALNAALSIPNSIHYKFTPCMNDPPGEYNTEVLIFLLSKMNKTQRKQFFRQRSVQVLKCCLEWPWQSLFLEMARRVWRFLDRGECIIVLTSILFKMLVQDYNYKKLFQDVWEQMPDTDKNYIINGNRSIVAVLDILLKAEDKETIKLVFKDVTPEEKNKLIFSEKMLILCKTMIYRNQWDSLKFIVQLLISSKDELVKFKQEFGKTIEIDEKWRFMDRFDIFFEILDDSVLQYDKEKNVEEDLF